MEKSLKFSWLWILAFLAPSLSYFSYSIKVALKKNDSNDSRSWTKTDDSLFFTNFRRFPASRGLSRRGKNERRERSLPAPDRDALFDEAADQISGRNLPVSKTGSVYCVGRVPHETIVFVFYFSACSF